MTTPKVINDRSEYDLLQKLKAHQAKRDTLLSEIEKEYDADKLRQLNILDHHITVAEQRLSNTWFNDEFPAVTTHQQAVSNNTYKHS
jgi:hypothetical protein